MNSWQTSNKHKQKHHSRATKKPALAAICLQVVDAGLMGILFVAPLFFGGRSDLGRLLFIGLTSVTGAAWFLRQAMLTESRWTRTWANAVALVALVIVGLQIVPLPAIWIEHLSPRTTELLPLWSTQSVASIQLGTWHYLSLTPSETKIALATLVAYVLLFLTVTQRLQTVDDVARLLKGVALATIAMGAFGLVQYLTNNGKFFWFYETPYVTTSDAVRGSFTCRNHFAHFLALGVGPLFAWILLRQQSSAKQTDHHRKPTQAKIDLPTATLYAALLLVLVAGLMTMSRGGAVALAIGCVVPIVIFAWRGLLSATTCAGLLFLGLAAVGGLSLSNYEQVARRLDDLTAGSLEELDRNEGRRTIWQANLASIADGSLFGAGVGSHREIYPAYLNQSLNIEYTHAENSYLQVATETGWLGIALLATIVLLVVTWCWRALRSAGSNQEILLAGAVTASLAVSLGHAVADFVWYVPACVSLTLMIAACGLRLTQLTVRDHSNHKSTVEWAKTPRYGFATSCSLAALWAVATAWGPGMAATAWDRYLLIAESASEAEKQTESNDPDFTADTDEFDQQSQLGAMIYQLRQILAHDPHSARAHLRLAARYLNQFDYRQLNSDNAMTVDQVRDAAIGSAFTSAQDLQNWLKLAFGDDAQLLYQAYFHAQQALRLCPLQGDGYQHLARLCFLEGRNHEAIGEYLSQSLRLRPHDGDVLFEAGRQQLLLGNQEKALQLWQTAFPDPGSHQAKIVQLLCRDVSPTQFAAFFQPDWRALPVVWQAYIQFGVSDELLNLLAYAEAAAQRVCPQSSHVVASNIWYALAKMQTECNKLPEAIASLEQAYCATPNEYRVRRHLGQKYLWTEQYEQAVPHLRWCLMRRPDDTGLKSEIVAATKSRLHMAMPNNELQRQ